MLRPWNLLIALDIDSSTAIYVQIADAIIKSIKSSKLKPGDPLPGSRQLALTLKVNRNTVVEALNLLLSEGWLISKERQGTFVATMSPQTDSPPLRYYPSIQAPVSASRIVFDDGLPDSRLAPIDELASAYRQIFSRKGKWRLMGYSDEAADEAFRTALAQMLNFNRGLRISADEMFITRGSQMATYLCAHCLVGNGDLVVVENPGYRPAWLAFESAGAKLIPVSVDNDGMLTDELKTLLKSGLKIKAVYTTPQHQFPTTVTMSLQRRTALIALSNSYGFTIIEDDYDNEFHFAGPPVLPLSSHGDLENYVYIGTMSKIMAPALRIGYIASSVEMITRIAKLRKIIDVQGDVMMAQAVLQLISDGHLKRHLKRAGLHYKKKLDFFDSALREHLVGKAEFEKPQGGLAFWLVPPAGKDFRALPKMLSEKGVRIIHPDEFSFTGEGLGLRLGYASLTEEQLEVGAGIIGSLL